MDNNTIIINDQTYDILFACFSPRGRQFLLLQQGEEQYVVRLEGDTVENASPDEVRHVLESWKHAQEDIYEHEGVYYHKQASAAGMDFCSRAETPALYHAFDKKSRQPIHLDEAGRTFVTKTIQAGLQENHTFLQNLQPSVDDPDFIQGEALCQLDQTAVYLDFRRDASGTLVFVEEGKVVVSPARQQELLKQFRAWEQDEYEMARAFSIANL